jgi:hypothetical protein
VLLQENFALLVRACARARYTPPVFLQRFASLSIQFSLCCYLSFVVVVVVFLIFFLVYMHPPFHRLVLNSLCSLLFIRDEGVTEERCRYGQGRQGTGLLLRYRQEDERYGSLLSIPFCAYVKSLSLALSHTHNIRVRFAFSCSLFLCCWDGGTFSLSHCVCFVSALSVF